MNPADLCELDDVTEAGRAWVAALRADLAVSHALVDVWEPAPIVSHRIEHPSTTRSDQPRRPVGAHASALRRPSLPLVGVDPVEARTAMPPPGRRTEAAVPSVRHDRRLATACALVLAPLFPLLARGGWT